MLYCFIGVFCFILGIRFSNMIKLRKLELKRQEVQSLCEQAKKVNNEMLDNFLRVYKSIYTSEEGKWTEIDDRIMSMWME